MSPDGSSKVCPNCGKPLKYKAVRCLECGKSLRSPLVAFDLEPDEPTGEGRTLLPSAVWDRLLGAALPFFISLLWVGGVWRAVGPSGVPSASLLAAPFVRFILPYACYRSLNVRFPFLAGGFQSALTLATQFLFAHVFMMAIAIFGVVTSCFRSMCSPPGKTPVFADWDFGATAGIAAATLLIQAGMAALLPINVQLSQGRIHVSRDARSSLVFLSAAVVLALAAAWWTFFPGGAPWIAVGAAVAAGMVALIRIWGSGDLTRNEKLGLAAVAILLTVAAAALALVPAWVPFGR